VSCAQHKHSSRYSEEPIRANARPVSWETAGQGSGAL